MRVRDDSRLCATEPSKARIRVRQNPWHLLQHGDRTRIVDGEADNIREAGSRCKRRGKRCRRVGTPTAGVRAAVLDIQLADEDMDHHLGEHLGTDITLRCDIVLPCLECPLRCPSCNASYD